MRIITTKSDLEHTISELLDGVAGILKPSEYNITVYKRMNDVRVNLEGPYGLMSSLLIGRTDKDSGFEFMLGFLFLLMGLSVALLPIVAGLTTIGAYIILFAGILITIPSGAVVAKHLKALRAQDPEDEGSEGDGVS